MLNQLPVIQEPAWLLELTAYSIKYGPFPRLNILRNSLYYPSSGFDGDPIKYLAGNFSSFIYVDYSYTQEEFEAAMNEQGFDGYDILAIRELKARQLRPPKWHPLALAEAEGDPAQFRDPKNAPFYSWVVMQRKNDVPSSHGPWRFSLLYLCADGVETFQMLYEANKIAPKAVAVIDPGEAFGRNWTNFKKPNQIFARTVLHNPAGPPELLLFGTEHATDSKHPLVSAPCWPDYKTPVCFIQKSGGGRIGVWKL